MDSPAASTTGQRSGQGQVIITEYSLGYDITEYYRTTTGATVRAETTDLALYTNPYYGKAVPAVSGYTILGYKLGSAPANATDYIDVTTIPSTLVNNNMNVYFIYDVSYTITEKYVTETGGALSPAVADTYTTIMQSVGTYSKAIPPIVGYSIVGYFRGATFTPPGNVPTAGTTASITPVSSNETIFFVYKLMSNATLTVYYMSEENIALTAQLAPATTFKDYSVVYGSAFALDGSGDRVVPNIAGYIFKDWKVGVSGTLAGNTTVSLTSVTGNTDVYLIYGR